MSKLFLPSSRCIVNTKSSNFIWEVLTLQNLQRRCGSEFSNTNSIVYFELQEDGTYIVYYSIGLTRSGSDLSGPTFGREDYEKIMPFILANFGKLFWSPLDHEYLTEFTGSQNESVCAQMITAVLLCNGHLNTTQLPIIVIHQILSCIPQTVFRIHANTNLDIMDEWSFGNLLL